MTTKKQMDFVTSDQVNAFIEKEEYVSMGEKTTVCLLTAINGMEVAGFSVRQDKTEHNEEVGRKWAKDDALKTFYGLAICYYNSKGE